MSWPETYFSLWRGEQPSPPRRVTMLSIAEQIAERYDVSLAELRGRSCIRKIAEARHAAMHAIRDTGKFSYPQIGRFFHRDHTSVIHGVRRHTLRPEAETER